MYAQTAVHAMDGDRVWVQAQERAATQGEDEERDKDGTRPTGNFGTDGQQDLGGVEETKSSQARRIVHGPGYLGRRGDNMTMEQHKTIK
jgi:hypothetical protein